MESDTLQQICGCLVHRGYAVHFDNTRITAAVKDSSIDQILCAKVVNHDIVRVWVSLTCPKNSDKLTLLETTNRLNMELSVSCTITLIEMDCSVMVGACFPYTYEDQLFNTFFDRFLEDVRHCAKVIKAVIEDTDEDKTIIRFS